MNPVLAQIRGQLPNETVSFGLLVRGKVIEGKRPAFIQAARLAQEATRKESGNIFYRFFWDARDPLEYVLLEAWQDFGSLAAHFESNHLQQLALDSQSLTEGPPVIHVLLDL
jgi:quinol monooxygenase YgiN